MQRDERPVVHGLMVGDPVAELMAPGELVRHRAPAALSWERLVKACPPKGPLVPAGQEKAPEPHRQFRDDAPGCLGTTAGSCAAPGSGDVLGGLPVEEVPEASVPCRIPAHAYAPVRQLLVHRVAYQNLKVTKQRPEGGTSLRVPPVQLDGTFEIPANDSPVRG